MGIVYVAIAIAIVIIAAYSPEIAGSFARVSEEVSKNAIEHTGNVINDLASPVAWALAAAVITISVVWSVMYVKTKKGDEKCIK